MADEIIEPRGTYSPSWPIRRLSWGAIFCGFIVALMIFLVLQLLGAGIGISTVNATTGDTPSPRAFTIGAGIWYLITVLIALFAGGWIAGFLLNDPSKSDRAVHGLVVWGLTYIAIIWVVSTTVGSILGSTLSVVGQTASSVATTPQAQQMIEQVIPQPQQNGAQQQQPSQQNGVQQPPQNGAQQPPQQQEGRDGAMQQAAEIGEQAATVTGATLIILSIIMVLAAGASAFGASVAPTRGSNKTYV